jgi:predicted RNA-binding protein with RPS1 domain
MAEQTELKVGAKVAGKIRHIGLYGALVDIGTGQDALLHVSQLGQPEFKRVEDVVQQGSQVDAYVLKIRNDGHVALTMEKPPEVPWSTISVGNTYTGKVTRIESFGIFVDFGAERPGMVHVSEMADGYVKSPEDIVSVGGEVEVRVLKVNRRPRQIDLTMKPEVEEVEIVNEVEDDIPTAMAQAFRRAMEDREDDEDEKNKKAAKQARRSQQDDIISRTLRSQNG